MRRRKRDSRQGSVLHRHREGRQRRARSRRDRRSVAGGALMSERVARLDWRTFMNASADTPASTIKALDDYFNHFAAVPIKTDEKGVPQIQTQTCCGCGKELTGIFGTWRWGIAHGVGECGNCRWPSHGHHFITDEAGEGVVTLRNFILQLHPDFVERQKKADVA